MAMLDLVKEMAEMKRGRQQMARYIRAHGHGAVIINGRLIAVSATIRDGRAGIESRSIIDWAQALEWLGY